MVIKESSDVLRSAEVVDSGPSKTVRARTGKDYLALTVATCGVGYLPIAPGTFGSLVGVGVYAVMHATLLSFLYSIGFAQKLDLLKTQYVLVTLELTIVVLVALVGIWAASRVEKLSAEKDPGKVVIDEVAGQYLALAAIPIGSDSWGLIVLAFLLFRLFDIVKPYPARKFEALHGGLGIMADDIVAGAYAALVVASVVAVRSFI